MSDTKALQLAVRAIEGFRTKNATLERQLAEARAATRDLTEKGYKAAVGGWAKERNRLCDQLAEAQACDSDELMVAENARLQERITETERLKAVLNRVLHPKGDGPPAPAWCDLIAFVEGDLARLQERVEEAEREIKRLKVLRAGASRDLEEAKKRLNNLHSNHTVHHEEHHVQVGELEDARDGFKALAERRKELLDRIQMLLNGDNYGFGAMHYFGQARPLYDGTRNNPVMDAKHYTMISWYLRAFQSISDGRARAAIEEGVLE